MPDYFLAFFLDKCYAVCECCVDFSWIKRFLLINTCEESRTLRLLNLVIDINSVGLRDMMKLGEFRKLHDIDREDFLGLWILPGEAFDSAFKYLNDMVDVLLEYWELNINN